MMRRKIKNVFTKQDYNCFACSPHNPVGLQLSFVETEEGVESVWNPKQCYEGYPGVIHGGILATLTDEVAAWTLYVKGQCSGVTSRLNVKYAKPVSSQQQQIVVKGKMREIKRSLAFIDVQIISENGELCLSGEAVYFVIPREKAVSMNYFPERFEDFFD
ncbi:MAG: PaaI family thioesterase [Bacteroidales bacterium]|jgi:uncharacterized protein (TIGR00369 family)|nr:PaaI family thioesterase [Bacteroidales bacterium]